MMSIARPLNVAEETLNAMPVLPQHAATDLTQGGRIAEIKLGTEIYRLRITRAGKLLLTK
ncbi:MAG: hemin uptake protein HemP [Pseudomonadota bacterium]